MGVHLVGMQPLQVAHDCIVRILFVARRLRMLVQLVSDINIICYTHIFNLNQ